jgi:predicted RNase H-like HicB family nuclease
MAHGETPAQALAPVMEAMYLWLDTAREFGDSIPEAKGRRLIFVSLGGIPL